MKSRVYFTLPLAILTAALHGCGTLNTDLSVPEKEIPETFPNQKGDATIASLSWRQYFADPLLVLLIDTAVRNNLDLQIALQRINMARSSVKLANGALLPKVSLNVGAGCRNSDCTRWTAQGTPPPKSRPAGSSRKI